MTLKKRYEATVQWNAQVSAQLAILLQDLQVAVHPPPSGTSTGHRAVPRGPGWDLKLKRGARADQSPASSGVAPCRHACAADLTRTTCSQLSHLCFSPQRLTAPLSLWPLGYGMGWCHLSWSHCNSRCALTGVEERFILVLPPSTCQSVAGPLLFRCDTYSPFVSEHILTFWFYFFFHQSLPGYVMREVPKFIEETFVCWPYGACKRDKLKTQNL